MIPRTEKLDIREGKGEEESADTYNEYIFDISYTACMDQEKTGTHNTMPQKPATSPNESDTLIIVSIESESPSSSKILQVHLGSVHWRTDSDPDRGVECADTLDELTQLLTMTIKSYVENGDMNPCICLGGTHWHTGDTNCPVNGTDGSHGQADELKDLVDALNASNNAKMATMSDSESAGVRIGSPRRSY